ncbi:MAG: nucleotidyl transferase AbiEii/AbiGii toxin family protein [Candidatus Omnitrophota bacterium]
MGILQEHEVFEIEVLERLKNSGLLKPLVFIGGTMLRLCYELNRYSTDLDFWLVRKIDQRTYFAEVKKYLGRFYEVTDAQMKMKTLLWELRSKNYPKRLKIEARRQVQRCDSEERIAFSVHSTRQVILKVHTLKEAMQNKIEAALNRKDIRDFFDIEFLLRQGALLGVKEPRLAQLKRIAGAFKENDYKVTLGSVLDAETRKYYLKNKFTYLLIKINEKK